MAIAACRRMRWRIISSSAPVRIGIDDRRDHQPVGGATGAVTMAAARSAVLWSIGAMR